MNKKIINTAQEKKTGAKYYIPKEYEKQIDQFVANEDEIEFIESDGLKILYKDKWVHIRKSNTEPIIRIISEASNKDIATHLINTIKNIIN